MGLIIAVLFFGAAGFGGWFWSALVLASILIGQQEMNALLGGIHVKPSKTIIWGSTFFMVLMASLDRPQFLSPILTLAVIASFFRLLFRSPRAGINDIGGTLIVVFYMVYMPAHFILLRHLGSTPDAMQLPFWHLSFWKQPGLHYIVMTLAVISASDIAAYYAGRAFGRHLLYPAISPKKTREGAIAGLIAGIVLGLATTLIWPFPWEHAVILSALLVVVGQLGDLTESMMKRDAGLKDSGELLASHGGFLDRADSYIFSGAVCYYYIYWVIYQQGLAPEVIHWFTRLGST
jgi:phosphatidate cytidylyltransferase